MMPAWYLRMNPRERILSWIVAGTVALLLNLWILSSLWGAVASAQKEFGTRRSKLAEQAVYVNERDTKRLGPVLLPYLNQLAATEPALSPDRTPAVPTVPVYLLHGVEDTVIPAVESELLAEDLRARGAHVTQLSTPLITHAEVDHPPTAGEVWELIRFWRAVGAAGSL